MVTFSSAAGCSLLHRSRGFQRIAIYNHWKKRVPSLFLVALSVLYYIWGKKHCGPKRLAIIGNLFNVPPHDRGLGVTCVKRSEELSMSRNVVCLQLRPPSVSDVAVQCTLIMGSRIILLNSTKAALHLLEKRFLNLL